MELEVSHGGENRRVDLWLSERLVDFPLSRSAVQRLIDEGQVTVNGKLAKSNYKTRLGDIVSVVIPEPKQTGVFPENIPLDVVYEDKCLIVVNKPQGMVVHPASGHYTGTLVNALLYHCGAELSGINGMLRPGIVHRIDRDTSGLLVAAKNDAAHKSLSLQLAARTVTRKYIAVVLGQIAEEAIIINKPICRHKTDRKKMTVCQEGGRRAVTHVKVIERKGRYAVIEARLETGRTHQIRVHMASIGRPLLGDTVYGSAKQPFNLQGQTLHAQTLGFTHPVSGVYMEFTSELPKYFIELIKLLH